MAVTDGSGSDAASRVTVSAPGLVVVTGADGFAGRAVCAHVRAAGVPFRGLVRTLTTATVARPDFFSVGDLTSAAEGQLSNVLRGAHTVVHLAGRVHRMGDAVADPLAEFRAVNAGATERLALAAAAAGVSHFVFASSVKVNGESTPRDKPFCESDPPDPHDDYAASKWEAECVLADVARETSMPVTILRLPLMYGPGVKGNLARLARAIDRGVPLPFASIDNRRSLLGVGNFASALDAVLAAPAPAPRTATTYLLSDNRPVSTPELARALAAALGTRVRLVPLPLPMLRVACACAGKSAAFERLASSLVVDASAFRTAFGWTPPRAAAEEWADMARAWREAQARPL